jgi:hypothetical protein
MKNWTFVVISFLILAMQPAFAKGNRHQHHGQSNKIEVTIIDEYDYRLPLYATDGGYNLKKSYMQALREQEYSIEVRNKTSKRVGFVVAVDGRNIITGKPSYLKNHEKMYILDGYQVSTFRGWRSTGNTVNRFYFTNENDSYAAAFNDHSAMGVIAVAAFFEKRPRNPPHTIGNRNAKNKQENSTAARRQPGTGWGSTEHSPTTRVKFVAQSRPFTKHLIKYEWHKSLCEMGIIHCNSHKYSQSRSNRLWNDNGGYATPPPSRKRVRINF